MTGTSRTRIFNHFILIPAALAAATLAAQVSARQAMMVLERDDGDAQGPQVMHFAMPDLHALRTPDYDHSDLPIFRERLRLDDEQYAQTEVLLDAYLAAFAELLDRTVGGNPSRMMTFQFGDEQHDGGGLFALDFGGLADDFAFEGAAAIAVQFEAGHDGMVVGEDVDVVAGGGGNGPAEPGTEIFISIAGPEGEEMPEAVREKLESRAKGMAEKIQKQTAKAEADGGDLWVAHPAMPSFEEHLRRMDELVEQAKIVESEKKLLRTKFEYDVKGLLSDEQIALWPRLEWKLTRKKTLPKARLDGEQTDLAAIIDELELSADQRSQLADVIESYEITLHDALTRRNAFLTDAQSKIDAALQEQEFDEAKKVAERATVLRVAVRSINDSFTNAIAADLDESNASSFREQVREQSYPRAYRPTRGLKAFAQARQLDDITDEMLMNILEIEELYRAELSPLNDRLHRAIRHQQPDEPIEMIKRMAEAGNEHGPSVFVSSSDEKDEVRALLDQRRDLDERYMTHLYDMLAPEQIAQLPKKPSEMKRGPIIFRSLKPLQAPN